MNYWNIDLKGQHHLQILLAEEGVEDKAKWLLVAGERGKKKKEGYLKSQNKLFFSP